jgi:preprotein translocase subunit SecG
MKNNFQKISLILSATLFIFLCFVFVFLYKKTNDNNKKAEMNAITSQTEMNRREEISSLDRSLQQNEKNKTVLDTHFIQSSDVVPFLNAIEKLAPLSGTKVEIDSVSAGTTNPGLIVGLKVSGSFQEIYKFLTLLENSPYEINFLSMDLHTLLAPETSVNIPSASSKNTKVSKISKSPNWEVSFEVQLLSFIQ